MKNFKKILLIIAIVLVVLAIGYVGYGIYKKITTNIPNPVATMEIEDYGTIKIELYPDKAPNTVANFICLANRGYYNGLTFHRTIPEFMIQGGDKNGDGSGSPYLSDIMDNAVSTASVEEIENEENIELSDKNNNKEKQDKNAVVDGAYSIEGEFIANGFKQNNLKHEKGVISMARADYSSLSPSLTTYGYNSAGSQFFIMTKDNTSLDGMYAAFGKVIEGMDIVEKVANTKVYYRSSELKEGQEAPKDKDGNAIPSDKPKKAPVIKSISVETYGANYGTPKTVEPFDYYSWLMQNYSNLQ